MADVSGVRRSGRRTIRPVEFWNFEKPDSKSEKIIYNLADLTKCSIYDTLSTKYLHETINKSTKNDMFVDRVSVNNVNETRYIAGRSKTVKGKGKLPHANNNNNKNETESVGGRKKIVKGKGKLPDAPRDASTDNSKEKTHEANEKERFNSNVNENESVGGRKKIVKGKGKLPDAPRDASTDNSKENTHEAIEKERSKNNVNETESVDGRSKIVKGEGKLPDAHKDASPDNSKNTHEVIEKERFNNNVNETESVDGRSKIVKGKGKLPDAPTDASPDNFKGNTHEANERERFNNNVNEAECVNGRSKIVKGKGKLSDAPKDVFPVNSRVNTNEANKKERLNYMKKRLATSATFKAPKGRYKRKNIEEENVQDSSERVQMKNDTVNQQQNLASFSYTVSSESVTSRRSGRIRTKPLEFWNFEKVEIKSLESGEISVVHHKQMLPPPMNRKGKEKEVAAATPHPSVGPARKKSKHTLQKLSPASSLSKRKFSSFCSSTNKEVRIEDEKPSKRKRTLDEEQDSTVLSTMHVTKISDLNFCQCTEKDYKCYLARSYQDTERDIHAGFVFLELGKVIWKTTRETNLYVLEGSGTLLVVDDTAEGVALQLKDTFQTTITSGKKIAITKDGRCKMLKLFIVLGSSSGTSSSIYQDDPISYTQEKQVTVS